eukprot:scaffold612923_cov35-Attheya_sp.AAC.1
MLRPVCQRFFPSACRHAASQVSRAAVSGDSSIMEVRRSLIRPRSFSSVATMEQEDHDYGDNARVDDRIQSDAGDKHCETCSCDNNSSVHPHRAQHTIQEKKDEAVECELQYLKEEPLPPPLPDPQYSFHRRVLPNSLLALTSPEGRQ